MTDQYGQGAINLETIQPVVFDTASLDPVDVIIGSLTIDGTGLALQTFGGGLAPEDPSAEAYRVRGNTIIARDNGALINPTGSPVVNGVGGVPTIIILGVGNNVVIRVTPGSALPYIHRIHVRQVSLW